MAQSQEPKDPQKRKPKQKQKSSQLNEYLKYTGLAFQMMAVIGLAVWGGWELDKYLGLRFPIFLIVLTLLSVTATIILTIKSLPK